MATLLYRLGKTAYRRWPIFLAAWLIAMVGVAGVAATMSKPMTDAFSIPGIPSEKAADLQQKLFPDSVDAFDQASVSVVVAAPEGHTLKEQKYADAVDALVTDLADNPQMPDATSPTAPVNPVAAMDGQRQQMIDAAVEGGASKAEAATSTDAQLEGMATMLPLSDDSRVGVITFDFDVETPMDVKVATQDAVKDSMDKARDAGLTVEANGAGMSSMAPPGGASELIGIGLALLVLILTFGSLVGAGLPIVTAMWGVGLGITGITAMTAFMDIGSSTPMLATMIGLAVGIDYALFILARYRTELHHTEDREEAVGISVGTAGSAVVFAGLTVLIALAALAVVRIPFLTAMGLAAAATVLIAVLVALTLLPAVLGLLKSKAFGGRVRKYNPKRDADGKIVNNGVRWARLMGKRPVAVVLLVVVALGALAVPLKNLHLAFPTDSTSSTDTTQRKASDLLTENFGPGREAPMLLVVDATDVAADARQQTFGDVAEWAKKVGGDEVVNASVAQVNEDGTGAMVMVIPASGPDEVATEDLLADLRAGQSDIEEQTGATTGVTGLTAITADVSERLADALPIYLSVVIGLAFILLMLVFRSILVPLTATLGFLLSVLATLGATVAVFQEGAFGIMEGQPIVSFMPIFLIGVVFGLAMDYQVFLVTRIREAHVHGADPRESVIDGFRNSARVVAAAAVIMTAVFAAFMLQDDPIIKSMGFALAVAVIFDAFVVRMTLIPAVMYLLGEKAWYLPRWLDRILPNVDVEGENLHRPHLKQDVLDGGDEDRELVNA
ncbi:MMPL family transporter [Nocardioides jensenii]|uniref:MMPL family transporter n=1 Tax=Nocardioides jensenii TaxID=1843 RepID=UPI000834182C|nr:MMPL family transporter [Nocardioides jensenii]